jgi:hypothetical protein
MARRPLRLLILRTSVELALVGRHLLHRSLRYLAAGPVTGSPYSTAMRTLRGEDRRNYGGGYRSAGRMVNASSPFSGRMARKC